MAQASEVSPVVAGSRPPRSVGSQYRSMELDTRLLGMLIALIVMWIGFDRLSGGLFLTSPNLWNLSVQSSAVAVMATGMVLIIVSRNIDLSVGSILGLTGYVMAMVQAVWIPTTLHLGWEQPYTFLVALVVGITLGALIGGFQGVIIAYIGVPSFIVTLGGLLVWRGLVFEIQQGQTISPIDKTFTIIGGGLPDGALGEVSWIVAALLCVGIVFMMWSSRRRSRTYGFPVRPLWSAILISVVGCAGVLAAVWVVTEGYAWPPLLAHKYAIEHHVAEPAGGLQIPVGLAVPVLILLVVALVMTLIATRRRFGRYVFAIGGNPEAAELAGINTRRTILGTYVIMGILCAISGAIQTARLGSGVTSLGTSDELSVIAAAVIGGTSFTGGIGTIPGAILGSVVMQTLRSGMLTLKVDSPIQDLVVGSVLVAAVAVNTVIGRRAK